MVTGPEMNIMTTVLIKERHSRIFLDIGSYRMKGWKSPSLCNLQRDRSIPAGGETQRFKTGPAVIIFVSFSKKLQQFFKVSLTQGVALISDL